MQHFSKQTCFLLCLFLSSSFSDMLSFTPFRSPAEVQQVDLLQRSLWDLTPYYFLDCRTNNITCFLAQYVAPISDNKGDFLEVLKMSIYFIED